MELRDYKILGLCLLCGLLLVILVQNTSVMTIRLLFWEVSMSRIIVLFLSLLSGFGVGYFVGKRS